MKPNQVLRMNDNENIEVCLFPMEDLYVTQGPGFYSDGTDITSKDYSTHCGSWAIDNIGAEGDIKDENDEIIEQKISNVYAPVTVKLVKKYTDADSAIYGNACIFSSVNPVLFPDYTIDYLDMEVVHCDNTDFLTQGDTYTQGSLIYKEGNHGISFGSHLHIEVRKRGNNPSPEGNYQFETNEYDVWHLIDNEPIQGIFFLNDTVIRADVPAITGAPSWKYYDVNPFEPVGKEDGWYEYNGDNYFVENETVKTGWIEVDGELYYANSPDGKMVKGLTTISNKTYYFDPATGAMQTGWRTIDGDIYYFDSENDGAAATGWLTYGGEYYYFETDGTMRTSDWVNDDHGVSMYYVDSAGMRVKGWLQVAYPGSPTVYWFYFNDPDDYNITTLNVGQKATSRWIASGSDWYYVNPDGKMLTRLWIAADSTGNVWYFVLSDGKMAYSCQIHASDDLYYAFNSSGVCIDNSGSTTKYNETTYPLAEDFTSKVN